MNTKKRIIEEALVLFSERGYSDVYVGDIAKAVGIKAPSLYKHFKNKQEIFEAILEELKSSYAEQALSIGIHGNNVSADAGIYTEISEEKLIEIGKNLFLYFLHDNHMRLFRKLLTLEQFHNSELANLYSRQYFEIIVTYSKMNDNNDKNINMFFLSLFFILFSISIYFSTILYIITL